MNAHVPYMEILLGPNRTPWNPPYTTGANATPPLLTTILHQVDAGAITT
jgi:hypothetical protein